jgi:hypothetical protein
VVWEAPDSTFYCVFSGVSRARSVATPGQIREGDQNPARIAVLGAKGSTADLEHGPFFGR